MFQKFQVFLMTELRTVPDVTHLRAQHSHRKVSLEKSTTNGVSVFRSCGSVRLTRPTEPLFRRDTHSPDIGP